VVRHGLGTHAVLCDGLGDHVAARLASRHRGYRAAAGHRRMGSGRGPTGCGRGPRDGRRRLLDELEATRTELAELAIGRERLRISRDLHDLLGHSLSAISLKGDLARRLLPSNVHAARAEIEGLTEVARDALRGVRAITRDEHAVSLRTETDGAAALLSAAGIDARIEVDLPDLARPTEEVLAWAVREGITNVLRHSQATACSITAARRDAMVRLEILNDGARPSAGAGTGLAGLAARARALSGSAVGGYTRGGRFRLLVQIPWEAA
jgi:two-component system, NarL family, sensor histidine kinase DesK